MSTKTAATKSPQIVSADDVLENVNDFIQSVYRDLSILSPPPNTSTTRRTISRPINSHRDASPQLSPVSTSHASSLNSSASEEFNANSETAFSPSNRHRFHAEVERINRICDNVDQNLRSIGIIMNNRSRRYGSEVLSNNAREQTHRSRSRLPADRNNLATTSNAETVYVDLSETQVATPVVRQRPQASTNDDEVVVVASNVIPIIDLCTPGHEDTSTRPVIQRSRLSRRALDHSNELDIVPTRRRRSSMKKTPEPEPFDDSIVDDQAKDDSAGRDPFICPVCMDSCLRRRPTSTKCGHVYCEPCIKQAIRVTHKCPLCNTKISASQLIRIYV